MAAAHAGLESKINHADYSVRCCLASVRWKQLHSDLVATRRTRRLHRDNDLAAASVALHQVPNGLRHLAQRKGPVDHRGELAGLDEPPQNLEVLLPRLRAACRSRGLTNRDSATARRLRSKPPCNRPPTSLATMTSVPVGVRGPARGETGAGYRLIRTFG